MKPQRITTYPKDSDVLPPSRKVKWPVDRKHFWTNWRVSTKKTNETTYAECKLCSDGKFYTGNMGLFSNFSRYVARKHEKELEIFVKSDLIWSKAVFHEYLHHSIGNCEKETNWAWKNRGKIVHLWEYSSELGTIAIVPWFLQIEYIVFFHVY